MNENKKLFSCKGCIVSQSGFPDVEIIKGLFISQYWISICSLQNERNSWEIQLCHNFAKWNM